MQSTNEAQALVNDEINETLDWSSTAPQLVDEKELGIPKMATRATLKRNKCGPKKVFKFVKGSVETALTRENFNECLGKLISNKSVNHNAVNSRECLSLSKNEINLANINNNDDIICHDISISHDDTCALKEDLNSDQVKCIKELKNVKDAFLKKLPNIEWNLEGRFKRKDEKYERLLNLLEKENLFLKDEIRKKDKFVNNLLDNFANRVPEHI